MGRYGKHSEEYSRLIGSVRWRKLRARYLAAYSLCAECSRKGLIVPATEVHHIVPVERGRDAEQRASLAYDPANLMGLCHGCHVELHRVMGKGTREEKDKRREEALRAWAREWLGMEPPGGYFSKRGEGV